MDLGILLLVLTLVLVYLLRDRKPSKKKEDKMETPTPAIPEPRITHLVTRPTISYEPPRQFNHAYSPETAHFPTTLPTWDIAAIRAYSQLRTRDQNRREKNMVEEWRKSIIGLIRLADQNLRLAKQHLTMGESKIAIQTAATSVENVARALIHSFGGKPDDDLGQEEALELLSFRFFGEEKKEFEQSIQKVVKIDIHTRNSLSKANRDENEARIVINLASEITLLFKKILIKYFATEMPELGETCPKCGSLDIQTLSFNQQDANFQCLNCQTKWTENRDR